MKSIVVIASRDQVLGNFKFELLEDLAVAGFKVTVFAPQVDEEASVRLEKNKISYYVIRLNNASLNPFASISYAYKLWAAIRKSKPDCVLAYTIKPIVFGSIAAKFAGVRNIFSIMTGLGFAFTADKGIKRASVYFLAKYLYRLALLFNKKVFFQNKDDAQLFIDKKMVHDQKVVLVNGSGVDLKRFSPVVLPEEPTFLFIGRILKDKGVLEYVEALSELKKKYSGIKAYMVGPLSANPKSLNEAELKNIVSKGLVEYISYVDDVRPIIAKSSIFVLPSYREGVPRSSLEAMAMGRAVITADSPGCRETVIDSVNGFLVEVGSSVSLALAMEKLILQPQLIVRMGEESRKIVEEKFDVHKVNKKIIKTMSQLASC